MTKKVSYIVVRTTVDELMGENIEVLTDDTGTEHTIKTPITLQSMIQDSVIGVFNRVYLAKKSVPDVTWLPLTAYVKTYKCCPVYDGFKDKSESYSIYKGTMDNNGDMWATFEITSNLDNIFCGCSTHPNQIRRFANKMYYIQDGNKIGMVPIIQECEMEEDTRLYKVFWGDYNKKLNETYLSFVRYKVEK